MEKVLQPRGLDKKVGGGLKNYHCYEPGVTRKN